MAWQSFSVAPPAMADTVADELRRQFALVFAIGLPMCDEVAVFRRHRGDSVRFFFSAAAVELFKTLVQFHGGKPCSRPAASARLVSCVPPHAPGRAPRDEGGYESRV